MRRRYRPERLDSGFSSRRSGSDAWRGTERSEWILSPLRLPVPPRAHEADSTRDKAILAAARGKDWERLGVLLGVADRELGTLIAAWPKLPLEMRQAVLTIVAR